MCGKIKVIAVDDHKVVLDGIMFLFKGNKSIELCAKLENKLQLFNYLKTNKPDIIILDIALQNDSGIEITKQIIKNNPSQKIIIFSGQENKNYVFESIEAGAKGFLPKTTILEELEEAILIVNKGKSYLSKEIPTSAYFDYINDNKKKEQIINANITEREKEVLILLSDGLMAKDIGIKLDISTRTVERHKTNLMDKLNVKTTVELVKFAIKTGIVEL